MYIKSFFLISSLVVNLGSASELCPDEFVASSEIKTASELLDNYYREFQQPVIVNENCSCELDFPAIKDSLANYYSEFSK